MNKIILNTDESAATQVTVTLWKSAKGTLYNTEDAARYDGCTHSPCEDCGDPAEKMYIHCKPCRDKRDAKRYAEREKIEWDYETPIYSEAFDKYIFNQDDLENILDEFDEPLVDCVASVLRLVSCKPIYLSQVPEDCWYDELSEDMELPDEIKTALEQLNDAIRAFPPVSWCPGKYAITL